MKLNNAASSAEQDLIFDYSTHIKCFLAKKNDSESTVREIRHNVSKKHSAEKKLRIVMDGLRDEDSTRKGDENTVVSLVGTPKDWMVLPLRRTGAKKGATP